MEAYIGKAASTLISRGIERRCQGRVAIHFSRDRLLREGDGALCRFRCRTGSDGEGVRGPGSPADPGLGEIRAVFRAFRLWSRRPARFSMTRFASWRAAYGPAPDSGGSERRHCPVA